MDQFIQNLARRAGAIVMQHFGAARVAYTKQNSADVVTAADVAANRLITAAIQRRYPRHGIISEEADAVAGDGEYVWIIDPLDGTRNFSTKTPLFGVMIGVARHGVMELAAIAEPCHRRVYVARRGRGAWCNGRRIHCAKTRAWAYSYGCIGAHLQAGKLSKIRRLINSAAREPLWVNAFGSAAVSAMYVADGRRDWYVSLGANVWDFAAGALLLAEAGCRVTNLRGEPWRLADRQLAAAPPALHATLLSLVGERR